MRTSFCDAVTSIFRCCLRLKHTAFCARTTRCCLRLRHLAFCARSTQCFVHELEYCRRRLSSELRWTATKMYCRKAGQTSRYVFEQQHSHERHSLEQHSLEQHSHVFLSNDALMSNDNTVMTPLPHKMMLVSRCWRQTNVRIMLHAFLCLHPSQGRMDMLSADEHAHHTPHNPICSSQSNALHPFQGRIDMLEADQRVRTMHLGQLGGELQAARDEAGRSKARLEEMEASNAQLQVGGSGCCHRSKCA